MIELKQRKTLIMEPILIKLLKLTLKTKQQVQIEKSREENKTRRKQKKENTFYVLPGLLMAACMHDDESKMIKAALE